MHDINASRSIYTICSLNYKMSTRQLNSLRLYKRKCGQRPIVTLTPISRTSAPLISLLSYQRRRGNISLLGVKSQQQQIRSLSTNTTTTTRTAITATTRCPFGYTVQIPINISPLPSLSLNSMYVHNKKFSTNALDERINSILDIPHGQLITSSHAREKAMNTVYSYLDWNNQEGTENATLIFRRIITEQKYIGEVNSSGDDPNNDEKYDDYHRHDNMITTGLIQKIIHSLTQNNPKNCVREIHDIVSLLKDHGYNHGHDHRNLHNERFPYNVFIGALTKCHRVDAAKYSTHLLQQALDQNNNDMMNGGSSEDYRSSYGIRTIINNTRKMIYNRSSDDDNASPDVQRSYLSETDTITFNSVISLWLNIACEESTAGNEAMRILNRMKGSYRLGNSIVKPNKLSFSMTMTAILRSDEHNAALSAEEVLQDMIYFYLNEKIDGDVYDEKPDKSMFDNIFHALLKSNQDNRSYHDREECLNRAYNLLEQMEQLGLLPDTLTYCSVIAIILSTKTNADAVYEIKKIIERMKNVHTSQINPNARVNTVCYNSLIKACTNNKDPKMAEGILRNMIHESQEGNDDVRPDIITWNSVLEAHAKSRSRHSVLEANRILHEMSTYDYIQPDKVTMSLMLIALTRSANRGDRNAGKQSLLILERMEAKYRDGNEFLKPDAFTYTQIINCIAKSQDPNCVAMATNVLDQMLTLRENPGREDLKADTATYNALLLAIANGDGADSASKFLKSMENSDSLIRPNVISYATVISAWAKSKDKNRVRKVFELLKKIEDDPNVNANTIVYSSALQVLAKSSDPKAVDNSLKILKDMEKRHVDDKSVRPNAYSYASVLEAIGNSRKKQLIATQTQQLLSRMIQNIESVEKDNVSYTIVFNNAIKAIEKSSDKNKSVKAKSIFELMKKLNESGKLNTSPTVRTYNAIIRCCAFTRGSDKDKRAAFDFALDAFTDLRKDQSILLDSYTYPSIFKACELLLGRDEKDYEVVKLLFYLCTQDGLVDALILNNLKNYLPRDVFKLVVQLERNETIPEEWSRNIKNNN